MHMQNWFNIYKYAQDYLNKKCYWMSPSNQFYGDSTHTLVLLKNAEELDLEEKYNITIEEILDRGKQLDMYEKLRNANFIRIHIANNGAYIDLENIYSNISRLNDILFKLNPKGVKYIQINNLPTFKLKDFLMEGNSLREYLKETKIAQNEDDIENIINKLPADWEKQEERDDFVNRLKDVAEQFSIEQRESFLRGEIGVLGYNHFMPRPGRTEISLNPDVTTDEILLECIEKFGDFPILLKWEGGDKAGREIVPASQFVKERRGGEYNPKSWTPQQKEIIDEWMELREMYRGEEMPVEIQQKVNELFEEIEKFPPMKSYVRYAEVFSGWNPPPVVYHTMDKRELEAQEMMRQQRLRRQK